MGRAGEIIKIDSEILNLRIKLKDKHDAEDRRRLDELLKRRAEIGTRQKLGKR